MPEITKPGGRTRGGRYVWIGFVVLIVFTYLFGLSIPLLGPDEPRYAQVAREMFDRGDWITPTLGGFNWFEKPALLYWLQIASYHVFGVTEFAARFGSALFGLGTVLCLYILGRAESGAEGSRSGFADWLALLTASTLGMIVFSRGASFDIVLTFPITASLVCFYLFDIAERRQHPASRKIFALAGFYFFIGIALIAKGLVGIVFPAAIAVFYYLLSWRRPSVTFIFSLVWGTVLAAAVASAWYLPMYLRHGYGFIDEFFIQHHFQRYTSNKYFHPQPFWFFLWVLPLMTIPWLPFVVLSIWSNARKFIDSLRFGEGQRPRIEPLALFALAWLLVPLVFFSFSGSKLPGYILPSVPPAIILAAAGVTAFISGRPGRARMIQAVAAATFLIVILLLQFVVPGFAYQDSVKGLIESANAAGFRNEKILNLHTTSHNAEFYGAGRLIRTADGKQKKFLGVSEVEQYLEQTGEPAALVLVPKEYLHELQNARRLNIQQLGESSEVVIVAVSRR